MAGPKPPRSVPSMRPLDVFKVRSAWIPPLVVVALLVLAMTLVYFGSVVNPTGHLHGLPVGVVNEDAGARLGGQRVDLGAQVASGLTSAPALSGRVSIPMQSLSSAEARMDVGKQYAAVVIPPRFTSSVLGITGASAPGGAPDVKPTIDVLTNPRAGTLGVSLATGVLGPALAVASRQIGQRLVALSTRRRSPVPTALLRDPVTVVQVAYRPLPPHSALGLSAFYIALLTTFCGFIGAIVVNTTIDAILGYAVTETGPQWSQRQPVAISRWHTLLTKWLMASGLVVVLTGIMLGGAIALLHMNSPDFGSLWLLSWFAATVVALGTLVLFAALGTLGQLVALLIFVYLALASSGGTVPLEALSGVFRFFANFEPLRQILLGVRSILYFNGSGVAGLTRAWVASGVGFVFWVALGVLVTNWYDRKGLDRMPRELMEYVDQAVSEYREQRQTAASKEGVE